MTGQSLPGSLVEQCYTLSPRIGKLQTIPYSKLTMLSECIRNLRCTISDSSSNLMRRMNCMRRWRMHGDNIVSFPPNPSLKGLWWFNVDIYLYTERTRYYMCVLSWMDFFFVVCFLHSQGQLYPPLCRPVICSKTIFMSWCMC